MTPADPLPPDVLAALQRGNKIEAIKLLRGHTGLGLKEAKDAVEAVEEKTRPASTLAPGEVPRSRGTVWWTIGLVVVALAAYYLFGRG